ncbi:hypothetical protein GCM10027278_04130 [Paralcaligenes ginsengisoli]
MGELEIDGQRRIQIGIGLGNEGDPVIALGGKRFEFDFCHFGLDVVLLYIQAGQESKKPGQFWFRALFFG